VRALIAVLALLGAIRSAQAETGNQLYSWCAARESDYLDFGLCLGYVLGVFDAAASLIPICGYNGVSNEQLKDITYQYLYSHPAERHEQANYLVARALKQAFPCHQ